MLANIAVLRTVKANVNEAIMVALPSILFESSHDKKDTQKYYLQGPAAEYIPVEIPDTYAKKFSKCATALAMQLVLLSNKTKGFFGPEICNVEGKDIQTARSITNSIMGERQAKFYRCVDEIEQTLDEQGDKEGARAIRNTSRDGYVKSYYEASRQTQPLGSPFVSYKPAFVIDNKDIALWHARNDNPQMRVRHILEYIENGEMVGKDVLEYDASTDKWHRIEAESIELV